MHRAIVTILLLAVAACGDDSKGESQSDVQSIIDGIEVPAPFPQIPSDPGKDSHGPTIPVYGLDDTLRLNEIQMKGSHNSYHLASDHPRAPEWTQYSLPTLTEQLEKHDVRQFELDIHYYRGHFEVFHLPDLDERTTCRLFTQCLREIANWSRANPGHHPIVVFLELKDEWDPEPIPPHMEELESEVRSAIPRNQLLTPDDVRRGYYGLQEAVEKHGWPTLGESRGKIMVVIMDEGEGAYRYTYNGTTLKGRSMFVTLSGWPFGVIMTIDDVLEQKDFIYEQVSKGKLVRSRVDDLPGKGTNYRERLKTALEYGAHMVATDYPVDYTIEGYAVKIPGGTPSRCNPVTARPECTSSLIESPLLLSR